MNPVCNGYGDFPDFSGVVEVHSKGPGDETRAQRKPVTTYQVRHPDYQDENDRFISFTRWRHSHLQNSTHLVNYGFFYTGEADLVRCYFCGLGLRDFEKSDDPLHEHIRYSGECGFLVQLLGPGRLRELKENLELNRASNNDTEINQTPRLCSNKSPDLTKTEAYNKPENHQYRHPKYRSVAIRVASFNGWPGHLLQTPQKVAEAGFYYTGVRDVVRCFSCDGGLQKWDPSDDPWIEHCVNFPYCKFLKETKGDDYIALALAHRHPQPKQLQPKQETVNEAFKKLDIQGDRREEKYASSRVRKVKFQVTGMGYSESDVDRVVDILVKEHAEASVENIIDKIEKLREEKKELQPFDVVKEHERLRAQLFCMQCKTEEINSLFLPCQHHKFCSTCSNNLTICPLCGRNIVHKVKTYRP